MIKKIKFSLSDLLTLFKRAAKIKKSLWFLGEHAFLTLLVLIFFILILGGLIFYKYSILIEREEPELLEKAFQFEEKAYQAILKEWQTREKKFIEASKKEYPDLFQEVKEEPKKPELESNQAVPGTFVHTIVKGATLWEIAQRYLGSGYRWQEIKKENGEIFTEGAAYYLQPGQKVIVPVK